MGRGALRDSGEGFPRTGLLHSDGPRCVADLLEVGHGIARGSGPVRNGVRSLGAVINENLFINDEASTDPATDHNDSITNDQSTAKVTVQLARVSGTR